MRRRLGRGGTGIVYLAVERETGRELALKTLAELKPSALLRLKQEFRFLARVRHPNLVNLYELVSADDRWFFTMELIEGTDVMTYVRGEAGPSRSTLRPSLVDTEPLTEPPPEAAGAYTVSARRPSRRRTEHHVDFDLVRDVMRQLACGVSALHERGFLHRDLKPSNILVTSEGRVVILDFGIAVDLAAPSWAESTETAGTPAYMAPEQATREPPGEALDWYAVGVVLYEMLTGILPFTGGEVNIIRQKQLAEPPPPRIHNPDVPDDLNSLSYELLRLEPHRRPSGPDVLARLGVARAPSSRTGRGELFGRANQWAVLAAALDQVRGGHGATVYVSGRSGMGKTALVHAFLEATRGDPSIVILSGRCYERESVPFKAVDALIDSLCRYLMGLTAHEVEPLIPAGVHALARMFPVLRRIDAVALADPELEDDAEAHELRRRAVAALREMLGKLAVRKTLILFVDDLQWGDIDSAPLIAGLTRQPDPPPLLFLAACRMEDETSSTLLQLLPSVRQTGSDDRVHRVEVGPLSDDQTSALVESLLAHSGGDVNRELVTAIARESSGHPFFVHELCRFAVTEPGLAMVQNGLGLDALIQAEVSGLPVAARRLLEVIAIAGEPIAIGIAAMAAGIESNDSALEAIRGAQLIRQSGTSDAPRLETYHDRIREALVNQLGPEARRKHHLGLALAYEALLTADHERLSVHFAASGDLDKAAAYAQTAGDHAAGALAHARAARLYEFALDLVPPEKTVALLEKLANALVNAGRAPEAAARYLELYGQSTGVRALDFRRQAAEQFLRSGHIDSGLDTLRAVLAEISLRLPSSARTTVPTLLFKRLELLLRGTRFRKRPEASIDTSRLMEVDICWSAAVGLSMIDPIRGAVFATRALLLALQAGEPRRIAMALGMQAGHFESAGASARADGLLQQAERIADTDGDPHTRGFIAAIRAISMNERAEFAASLVQCQEAEQILRGRCTGVAWELRIIQLFRMTNLYYLGRVRDIAKILPDLMAENRESGDLFAAMNLETLFLPFLLILRGDREAAVRNVEVVDRWAPDRFYLQHIFALEVRTMSDVAAGEPERAYQRILDTQRALDGSLLLHDRSIGDFWRFLRATTTIAAAEVNPHQRARRLRAARAAGRRLVRNSARAFQATGKLVLHSVAALEGKPGVALALARDALAGFEATGLRLHGACARWRIGELLGGDEGASAITAARAFLHSEDVKDMTGLMRVYTGLSPRPTVG